MATIVNTRDVILQAAGTRILNVSLPSNITSIPNSVTVTGGYGSLGTIANNANQASVDASNAVSQLSTKLSKSSSDILSGTISVTTSGGFKAGTLTWDSAGNITGGSGVAMTAKGIIGASGGTPTFTIDTNGNASYLGTISASQVTTGVLNSVSVNTSGYVRAYGANPTSVSINGGSYNPTIYATGAAGGNPALILDGSGTTLRAYSSSGRGAWFDAYLDGVYASSQYGSGLYGVATSSGAFGVSAVNGLGGVALQVVGNMTMTSGNLVTNLNADRVDNYHAGNSSGQIAVSNGSTCTSLNADMLDGYHESSFVKIASGRSNNDYLSYVGIAATAGANLGYIILQNNAGTQVKVPLYAM